MLLLRSVLLLWLILLYLDFGVLGLEFFKDFLLDFLEIGLFEEAFETTLLLPA
jgi:hypothetical protein